MSALTVEFSNTVLAAPGSRQNKVTFFQCYIVGRKFCSQPFDLLTRRQASSAVPTIDDLTIEMSSRASGAAEFSHRRTTDHAAVNTIVPHKFMAVWRTTAHD